MILPWILAVVVATICVAVRIGLIATVGLQTGSVDYDASIIGQSSQHIVSSRSTAAIMPRAKRSFGFSQPHNVPATSPLWNLATGTTEYGATLSPQIASVLNMGFINAQTGKADAAVWRLFSVLVDAAISALFVMVSHELGQTRAWRATARRSTRILSRLADSKSETMSKSPKNDLAGTAGGNRAEHSALEALGADDMMLTAEQSRSWPEWRARAAGWELGAAASQPLHRVLPVPAWWLSREHTWGVMLAGLVYALHPVILIGRSVLGEGELWLLLVLLSALLAMRGRWMLAQCVAASLVLVWPLVAMGVAVCATAWRVSTLAGIHATGHDSEMLSERVRLSAWTRTAAFCAAMTTFFTVSASLIFLVSLYAPHGTLLFLMRYTHAPTAVISASPAWYVTAHAPLELRRYITLMQAIVPLAALILAVLAIVPVRLQPHAELSQRVASALHPGGSQLEWITALLFLPVAVLAASPEASTSSIAASLCLLLVDPRILTQWQPPAAMLFILHLLLLVLPHSIRSWRVVGSGSANFVFAEQCVLWGAFGVVVSSWAAAAWRYATALETAKTMASMGMDKLAKELDTTE